MTKPNLKLITDIPADGQYHDLGFKTRGIRFPYDDWCIYYYSTEIVHVSDEGVFLDAGGYRSDTTMSRMNFYLKPLGIEIIVEDDEWVVANKDSKNTCPFMDQMIVGGPEHCFDLHNCSFGTDLEIGCQDLLEYLDKEIEEYGIIPDEYSHDIAEALNYRNPDMAVLSLDHKDILAAFKKLCYVRMPEVAKIIQKFEVQE